MRTLFRAALGASAAAVAVVVAGPAPAVAINSYNATPAPVRTEVGALVATWDDDGNPVTPDRVDWVCSGTMIDADTFLTAAHVEARWSFTPAALPTANQLGRLGPQGLNTTDWFVAGYGTQEAVNGP